MRNRQHAWHAEAAQAFGLLQCRNFGRVPLHGERRSVVASVLRSHRPSDPELSAHNPEVTKFHLTGHAPVESRATLPDQNSANIPNISSKLILTRAEAADPGVRQCLSFATRNGGSLDVARYFVPASDSDVLTGDRNRTRSESRDEPLSQHDGVVTGGIPSCVQQRHNVSLRSDENGVSVVPGLFEFLPVPSGEFVESIFPVSEPASQFCGWSKIDCPHINRSIALSQTARPQAVDEDSQSVTRIFRFIDAFDLNLHAKSLNG